MSSRRRGAGTIEVQLVHALRCRRRACRRPVFLCTFGQPDSRSLKMGEQLGQRANSARREGCGRARERDNAPTGSHVDGRQARSRSHIECLRRCAADDHRRAHCAGHIGGLTTHRSADRPKRQVQWRTGSHDSRRRRICLRSSFDGGAGADDARRHDPFYRGAKVADGSSRLAGHQLLCARRPAFGGGAPWSVDRRSLVLSERD